MIKKNVVTALTAGLFLLIMITGCPNFNNAEQEVEETGDIPIRSLSIPEALTTEDNRSLTTRAGTVTEEEVFEPFRASLALAEEVLVHVDELIAAINANPIPDNYSGTNANGDTVTVSTETILRDLEKRIEWEYPNGDLYLQINYTPDTVKGSIIYHDVNAIDSEIDKIRIDYDETGTYPVLTGWLTIKQDTPLSDTETEAEALYFRETKNNDGLIEFEGGVIYNYVTDIYDDGDSNTTTDGNRLIDKRAYMFRALTSSDGNKAEVNLYFPPAETTATLEETNDIKTEYLGILFEWVETANSLDLDTILGQSPNTVTDGTTLGTVLNGMDSANIPDDLAFVINLTNPIAYSDSTGYLENGTLSAANDLTGDPAEINFTKTPDEIWTLCDYHGGSSTILDFLTD